MMKDVLFGSFCRSFASVNCAIPSSENKKERVMYSMNANCMTRCIIFAIYLFFLLVLVLII